jgi:hypothetical protein
MLLSIVNRSPVIDVFAVDALAAEIEPDPRARKGSLKRRLLFRAQLPACCGWHKSGDRLSPPSDDELSARFDARDIASQMLVDFS